MKTIGWRELERRADEILRDVRDNGEEYAILVDGQPAARLIGEEVSVNGEGRRQETEDERRLAWDKWFEDWDQLAARISAKWPDGVSAAEAVAEQRRKPIYGDP
jgi:antitoxin (DNA-binding transcriptional repressor) of toxin-antitoxin stability system